MYELTSRLTTLGGGKVCSLITKDNRRRSPTKTGSHIRAISFVISERTLLGGRRRYEQV